MAVQYMAVNRGLPVQIFTDINKYAVGLNLEAKNKESLSFSQSRKCICFFHGHIRHELLNNLKQHLIYIR